MPYSVILRKITQHAEEQKRKTINLRKRKVIAVRTEKYSIVVVDGDVGFADELGSRIACRGDMELCGTAYSGDLVLPLVQEHRPDILIMDLTLPALDGISVIRVLQKELTYKPVIVITSAYSNDMQRYLIQDIPNAYFVRKPVSYENLLDRAAEFVQATSGMYAKAAGENVDTERVFHRILRYGHADTTYKRITGLLHDLGVPAHLSGYGYLRDAVCMVIEKPILINNMTKQVYPTLAARSGKTAASVEKAIRTAVEVSWSRGRADILEEVFGFTVSSQKGKPTNTEYIAMLADRYNVWMK